MNINVIVIGSIVWLVSYVLFLTAVSSMPIPDSTLEIVKMAVTGLFGIVTGAAGALIATSKNAPAPEAGQKEG